MSGNIKITRVGAIEKKIIPTLDNLRQINKFEEVIVISYQVENLTEEYKHLITVKQGETVVKDKEDVTSTIQNTNGTITCNIAGLQPNSTYTVQVFLTDDIDTVESTILTCQTENAKQYGVRVDETNSNPATCCTYINGAVGVAPANSTGLGGWSDIYPFNKIKLVGFKNGQETGDIDPYKKTHYLNGQAVPQDVDVMVKIPKIYWKFTNTSNGYEVRICRVKADNEYDCYAHKVGGVEKDAIYVGAYLGYVENNKLRSRSGVLPTGYTTLTNFRNYAHNVGQGYQQFNWFTLILLQNLYLIAYKNLNSQTVLGYGYANGNSSPHQTGGTNTKGMIFGESGGKQQVCFLGIEDFYGNIWQWVDGMFCNNSYQIMVTPDNKIFNDNASGYKNIGKFVSTYDGGRISKVAHTNEGGFFPKEFNGSDTTYYCDYGYANSDYFARFGSSWNEGFEAGAFFLDVSCSPPDSRLFLGSRLVFLG